MKTIITSLFLTAFTCFGFYAKGQDGLTFSKVIMLEKESAPEFSFTIPAGKVWKIENVSGLVDGTLTLKHLDMSYVLGDHNLPLWLPAGYQGIIILAGKEPFINIIEYTITTK
jgi:hypothetical protein